jgi:hypothetical protein
MITLASDSTTRRDVGKFIGMGVHIGREGSLTLPLLGIGAETKKDIALQLSMGLEQLSICSGVPVKELLEQVDALFTDSVDHNKGVNFILQEMFDLDKPPGQLFCGTHTCLGFSNCQNKMVMEVERKMKLETVLSQFMVGMELDSKSGSLAGQALDMQLKLVAPEYKHKSWNYHGLYTLYLEQRGVELSLFSYKDARFGLLGRASAVLLHNYNHLEYFLSDHPHISNKLACLVRELMNLPHLKVIYSCFALLGVHLVEPFYSRTIQSDATHSTLKVFYQGLYDSLTKDKVTTDFILLEKPHFPGVSDNLFSSVKQSYGDNVLRAVKAVALEQEEDVLLLINYMLPEMAKVLGRQRRDYGLDEVAFPVEFRVEDQASWVDDTPTNNMDMERLMGKADYRLQKLQTLPAASRSIVLQKTRALREASQGPSFRSFRKAVEMKREKEVEWNASMKEKFSTDAEKKQEVALVQERKRLTKMEDLKICGGPFTNAEEVEQYLGDTTILEKTKQQRMKKEVQFARESSTTLPKVDPIFKIQVTHPPSSILHPPSSR